MTRSINVGEKENLSYKHLITLFNVAYKIFVKTLKLQLQSHVVEVIDKDHMTFLLLQYILDNVFFTQKVID
jgi:hypothetical protein